MDRGSQPGSAVPSRVMDDARSSARRGVAFGLVAAVSFGVSAPFAQRLVAHVDAELLAGLLYLGAGLVLAVAGSARRRHEAGICRGDLPRLATVVVAGGVLAPVLFLLGLERVSALSGSLMLNLEAPFTALLAVWVFGEYLTRRAWIAGLIIVMGATVLGYGPGGIGTDPIGVALIAFACGAWALDNNLTQGLTVRDPVVIVRVKAFGAASANVLIALVRGAQFPAAWVIGAALALGALSYGLSVLFDAYALRLLGAAREAALFATAPFAGAVIAIVVLGERMTGTSAAALALMVVGTALLLTDRHEHEHRHRAMAHEHRHVHDEHHHHDHPEGTDSGEPHSHWHEHQPLVHTHGHVSDAHHRHRHRLRKG